MSKRISDEEARKWIMRYRLAGNLTRDGEIVARAMRERGLAMSRQRAKDLLLLVIKEEVAALHRAERLGV